MAFGAILNKTNLNDLQFLQTVNLNRSNDSFNSDSFNHYIMDIITNTYELPMIPYVVMLDISLSATVHATTVTECQIGFTFDSLISASNWSDNDFFATYNKRHSSIGSPGTLNYSNNFQIYLMLNLINEEIDGRYRLFYSFNSNKQWANFYAAPNQNGTVAFGAAGGSFYNVKLYPFLNFDGSNGGGTFDLNITVDTYAGGNFNLHS